jgi:mono/diheme cytochrome c family protein
MNRVTMRYGVLLAAAAGLGVALVLAGCSQPPPPPPAAPVADLSPAHGKYLVDTHGCHDCHTPLKMGPKGPEPDMSRMLSGHPESEKITAAPAVPAGPWMAVGSATMTAWAGPWGVSFTMNLTPDQNTGIGIWTEKMFIDALRTGKHMGTATSRDILPPMPWPAYGQMNDDELKAIWAYLRTIPPITNHIPDPIPPAGAAHGK